MKLKFIPPAKPKPKFSASIQKSGRLGFTIETAKHFGINSNKSMKLAIDDETFKDGNELYGELLNAIDEESAYKIQKNGDYHSVNSKSFFDALGLKYLTMAYVYTIEEIKIEGLSLLKFTLK